MLKSWINFSILLYFLLRFNFVYHTYKAPHNKKAHDSRTSGDYNTSSDNNGIHNGVLLSNILIIPQRQTLMTNGLITIYMYHNIYFKPLLHKK